MEQERLSQSLRGRLVVLVKQVIATQLATSDYQPLTFNRLSGAVYQELLQEKYVDLTEDQSVDVAVSLTGPEVLGDLLSRYDARLKEKSRCSRSQVEGMVENMVPRDMENRERVIADTLAMLEKFPLTQSILGIRKLVQARLDNGNLDVDELDFLCVH